MDNVNISCLKPLTGTTITNINNAISTINTNLPAYVSRIQSLENYINTSTFATQITTLEYKTTQLENKTQFMTWDLDGNHFSLKVEAKNI